MARPRDPSWLLGECPENKNPTLAGESRLWWGVVRQAAYELRFSRRSIALDALEFLRGSGPALLSWLFAIPARETQEEIVALVMRRDRSHIEPLGIGGSAGSGDDGTHRRSGRR